MTWKDLAHFILHKMTEEERNRPAIVYYDGYVSDLVIGQNMARVSEKEASSDGNGILCNGVEHGVTPLDWVIGNGAHELS